MGITAVEFLSFLGGIFLLVSSGFLWSLFLFKEVSIIERIVIGFGFAAAITVIAAILFSLLITVTLSSIAVFLVIFILVPLLVLAIKRYPFKKTLRHFSFPEKDKLVKLLLLLGILAFIFYMAFLPHLTKTYDLPFHADEWVHWGYTREFLDTGQTTFSSPFTGQGERTPVEIGFHVFSGSFVWLSGIKLQTLFLLMPSALATLTGLAAFAVGEHGKTKFGLAAAFFVAFLPTSNRFLGPSFYVPLSLALFLVLLSVLILQQKSRMKYPFLFLILAFTALVHPPSAVMLTVVILCFALLTVAKKRYFEAALLFSAVIVPVLVVFISSPQYLDTAVSALLGQEHATQFSLVDINAYLGHLGYVAWALFFLAAFLIIYKGKTLERGILASATVFFGIIFAYHIYTFGYPTLYVRAISYLFLFMLVLAGYGLAELVDNLKEFLQDRKFTFKNIKLNDKKVVMAIAIVLPILLCSANAVFGVPKHIDEPYYKVINEREFTSFDWIRENIDGYRDDYHSYDTAAVTPLKAASFSAVTGVNTISSSFWPQYGTDIENEMKTFLRNDAVDTDFMEKHDIGVVYGSCENDYCNEVYDSVFLYPGVPPVANFTVRPQKVQAGETIEFVDTSTTRYGSLIDWEWKFGDGDSSPAEILELQFDGKDDYVKIPNDGRLDLNTTREFTVSFWFRVPDIDRDEMFLFHNGRDKIRFTIWGSGAMGVIYYSHANDDWKGMSAGKGFDDANWHHASYRLADGEMEMYVDGQRIGGKSFGYALHAVDGALYLGRNDGSTDTYSGTLKDVRVYDIALSKGQIQQLLGGGTIDMGLVGHWKLDDFRDTVSDAIGYNDATVRGATWIRGVQHVYAAPGTYEASFTVRNEDGLTDTITKSILVTD